MVAMWGGRSAGSLRGPLTGCGTETTGTEVGVAPAVGGASGDVAAADGGVEAGCCCGGGGGACLPYREGGREGGREEET